MTNLNPQPHPDAPAGDLTRAMTELLDKIELGLQIGAEADEICNAKLERRPGHIDSDIRAAIKAAKQLRKALTPAASVPAAGSAGDTIDN